MPDRLRSLLLGTLVLGLIGTEIELLLLEHFEDVWQYVPLVLMGSVLVVLVAYARARRPVYLRIVQGAMLTFILAGTLGVWLHYLGNADFELELTPDMAFWPLFKAAITGATPVLAPGAMVQLGLIGLAWTYRHPLLHPAASQAGSSHSSST